MRESSARTLPQSDTMLPATFDELQRTLREKGSAEAVDQLCDQLRQAKDYRGLFYALLMKRRLELGVTPIPTGPAADLPAAVHAPYEDAIREAGRHVGRLYLDEGNIAEAWFYFRMLGEPEPVARALAEHTPGPDEDVQPLVHLAFYEGLVPKRGFDWILERYGICNAITTLGSQELPHPPDVRQYCIGRLVRALYAELRERLLADIERQEGKAPPHDAERPGVRELIAGRENLFADGFAHIDVSHLSSVVQMSVNLEPGEELNLARELCAYGELIPKQLHYNSDPPFDDLYRDYGVYLSILAGERVEEGLAHFRAKADSADPETIGTYPAQVLVNLLLRLGRPAEALEAARRHLTTADPRHLSCPGVLELCQRAGDYGAFADAAREQGDAVHYLAGLIQSGK
jgi:hypothetical protein